jgi:hypothetical protein
MQRVVPNKCWNVRAEVGGRAYRIVSFFYNHPSEIPEDEWSLWQHGDSKVLIDKMTFAIMAECQCEFLSREADSGSSEPAIVTVQMTPVVSDVTGVKK